MLCTYTEGILSSLFQARATNVKKKKSPQNNKQFFKPHKLSKEINCPVILLVENVCMLQTVLHSTVTRVIGFPLHPKVPDLLLLIRDIKHGENSYICHISCKIIQAETEMVWSQ